MLCMKNQTFRYFEHPILGVLVIGGSVNQGLSSLDFAALPPNLPNADDPLLKRVEDLLQRYLLGERVDFNVIPFAPEGTSFQQAVWNTLCRIPYGETRSYKWMAEQLAKPNASRAVGNANGKNPIPILIPCHRVIHQDGSLGGYSGGLHVKQFLLALESHRKPQQQLAFFQQSQVQTGSITLL